MNDELDGVWKEAVVSQLRNWMEWGKPQKKTSASDETGTEILPITTPETSSVTI
jgi:hypothetical protein